MTDVDVGASYDRLASRWEAWANAGVPPLREAWVAKLDGFLSRGARVVELGCGTGAPIGQHLAARYDWIGVDVSWGMLQQAQGNRVRADMSRLAFKPASLDAAVAFFSIINVPRARHAALFASIASWLQPGGMFVASLTQRDVPGDREDDWLGAGPMFWSGFDAPTNAAPLRAAGFEIVESEVIEHVEPPDDRVKFFWVLARKPQPSTISSSSSSAELCGYCEQQEMHHNSGSSTTVSFAGWSHVSGCM